VRRLWFLANHRLRTSLWLIPLGCAFAGMLLSFATIAIDRATDGRLISRSITGDPNAGLQVFQTVAASMVSLTALVLSITAVVVQLAMGQFSPRSVRPFLQDRPSQFAIGIFVGTFAHAMVAMREVDSFTQRGFVPGVTVLVSYGLVLVSVLVLVVYVHHIGNALKVDSIIESIGDETRQLLDKLYPSSTGTTPNGSLLAERPGTLFRVDEAELLEAARTADVTLELTRGVGQFVPEGAPLIVVHGDRRHLDVRRVRKAIAVGPERTMDQDGAFGIQTLVDIAERALTENFNDQTTAAQAIDRIHDIMRQLALRDLPSGRVEDESGDLRLVVPAYSWNDYVAIAFDSLIDAAQRAPAVIRRIRDALDDLIAVAPSDRRPALEGRRSALGDTMVVLPHGADDARAESTEQSRGKDRSATTP
jgi:uncharacterized membrane protein